MSISTRSAYYPSTPKRSDKGQEYDTLRKTRFYDALDRSGGHKSLRQITREYAPSYGTGARWKKERELLGSPSYRRTRKLSCRLGAPLRVSKETAQMLVNPNQNPVREHGLEAQLAFHNIDCNVRTIQRSLKTYTNNGRKYKQAYVGKVLSGVNKDKRVEYGTAHQGKTIEDFWANVFFTDEAHIDPSAQSQGWILREQGTRYNTENIQQREPLKGVKLHIAGWINWYSKCSELRFYHNEEEKTEHPKRAPRPRKSKYEIEEDFQQRLVIWEAAHSHDRVSKPKGNSMTQQYYHDKILPMYIEAIQKARFTQDPTLINGSGELVDWLLQEDNDGSHGHGRESKITKKPQLKSLATAFKEGNWIVTLNHPPQSPDLNPIEGVWCILKQRIRKRIWNNLDELKGIIQDEWLQITMAEVRERISDMPGRCDLLVKTGGEPIKGQKW